MGDSFQKPFFIQMPQSDDVGNLIYTTSAKRKNAQDFVLFLRLGVEPALECCVVRGLLMDFGSTR